MLRFAAYLLVCIFLIAGWAAPASATKRVALVIGNSAYEHAPVLKNPKNDATAISAVLEKLGFDVVTGIDLKHVEFAQTIGQFRKKLKGADVGLFFYAGHGLQVQGENYLAPLDAELDNETSLDFEAVPLRTILKLMERSTKTNLVFLDACRDNPLARNLARSMGTRSTGIGRGLAREESGLGTLISFATQPGNVALDGSGKNSPFATGMLKHMETPGLDVALVLRRVREEVIKATSGSQVPWTNSSLTGSFMFKAKVFEDTKTSGGNAAEMATNGERMRKAEEERKALQAERSNIAKERAEFVKRLDALERQAKASAEQAVAKGREVAALKQSKSAEKPKVAPSQPDHPFDGPWKVTIDSKTGCLNNGVTSYIMVVHDGVFVHDGHMFRKKGSISSTGEFNAKVYKTGNAFAAKQTAKIAGDRGKGRMQGRKPSCKGNVTLVRLD